MKIAALLIISAYVTITLTISADARPLDAEIGQKAIEIAETIEAENIALNLDLDAYLDGSEPMSNATKLATLRTVYTNSLQGGTQSELQNILDIYESLARTSGNARDIEIAELFEIVTEFHNANISEAETAVLRTRIQTYIDSKDWFVRHRANLLSSEYQTILAHPANELSKAQETFLLIPTENNLYVQESKLLSASDLAFLYTSMKNPNLAVANASLQIQLHQETGLPLDGMGILYNLMYAFTAWGDFDTSKTLGETLLRLERINEASTPGLTSMRMASVLNRMGQYENALNYSAASLIQANFEPIVQGSKINQIIAYAGLGRTDKARSALKGFTREHDVPENSGVARNVLFAEALIESRSGEQDKAIELFNERLDEEVRHLLGLSNAETSSLLADLQNTADRRAEREQALETQAALKAEALRQEQQKNLLLLVLLGLLAAATLAITSQLRYRAKVSRQLAEAAEAALAGEQAKASFLAVASHELRTPLNGIIGLSDVLTREAPTQDLRHKNATVLQCGHDLLMTVENMLDMSLINGDSLKIYPEIMNLKKVVAKLDAKWRPVIERKAIKFTVHVDRGIPDHLFLDAKRIGQCLEILISNSVKFTEKGRIHIHLTNETEQNDSNLHQLKIVVADTGIGMDDETMKIMFEPFVQADSSMTRQYGGNGLGLALAKYLTKTMKGDIKVNSKDGRGTEVTIDLPVRSPQMMAETAPSPINKTQKNSPMQETLPLLHAKSILIVEDDLASQNVLKTYLEPEGCSITCLPDGTDVLETLRQRHFDLILMDIRMPNINGIQTTKNIRQSGEEFSQIPIIAVTADIAPETNARCMVAGVDVFLTKPINARALFDATRFVLTHDKNKPKYNQAKATV